MNFNDNTDPSKTVGYLESTSASYNKWNQWDDMP